MRKDCAIPTANASNANAEGDLFLFEHPRAATERLVQKHFGLYPVFLPQASFHSSQWEFCLKTTDGLWPFLYFMELWISSSLKGIVTPQTLYPDLSPIGLGGSSHRDRSLLIPQSDLAG